MLIARHRIARWIARYSNSAIVPLSRAHTIVSFTFDDAFSDACTKAAEMIKAAGGFATYYISGIFDRTSKTQSEFHTAQELRRLYRTGHELGCHGYSHIDYQKACLETIEADIARNQSYFVEHDLPIPESFAYPYGGVNRSVKRICSKYFRSCRGLQPKINLRSVDLALLKSIPLYSHRLTVGNVTAILDKLVNSGGWLIFNSHNVTAEPGPFDCTPHLLSHTLSEINSRSIPILPVNSAVKLIVGSQQTRLDASFAKQNNRRLAKLL